MQTIEIILLVVGNLLVFLAGMGKAGQDILAHHYQDSVFWALNNDSYWDITISGNNKWKNGLKSEGEKFWQSSRLLVFLSEGWHLFDMIRTKGFAIGLTLALFPAAGKPWYVFFGVAAIMIMLFSFTFELFYNKVFRLKLHSIGDYIEWEIEGLGDLNGKHWAMIQAINKDNRCYGVYAEYGQDYIPFNHCKLVQKKLININRY